MFRVNWNFSNGNIHAERPDILQPIIRSIRINIRYDEQQVYLDMVGARVVGDLSQRRHVVSVEAVHELNRTYIWLAQ